MSETVLALSPAEAPGLAIRILSVLGGALVGALLLGFLATFFVRLLTTRAMPVWGVRSMRLLGAVAGGWLVGLFVFGDGIGGIGGWGGWSSSGNDSENKDRTERTKDQVRRDPKKDENGKESPAKDVVRITVLSSDPLLDLFGENYDVERCYRIEDEVKKGTLSKVERRKAVVRLEDLKMKLEKRLKDNSSLRAVVVLYYQDSPESTNKYVKNLTNLLYRMKLVDQDPEKPIPFDHVKDKAP